MPLVQDLLFSNPGSENATTTNGNANINNTSENVVGNNAFKNDDENATSSAAIPYLHTVALVPLPTCYSISTQDLNLLK